MSLDASLWAWKQKCGKSSSKLVLLSIADRAGADHCAYPSIETLSKDTELNPKTVRSAIKHLTEVGLIRDTKLRKGPTQQVKVYQLIGVIGRDETLPKTDTFKDTQNRKTTKNGRLPKTDLKTTENGLEDTQNWVAEPINNQSLTCHIKDIEKNNISAEENSEPKPTKPPARKSKLATVREKTNGSAMDHISDELLTEWVNHKKTLSDRVLSKMIKELDACAAVGITATDAVIVQLENAWQGFEADWVIKKLKPAMASNQQNNMVDPNNLAPLSGQW